MAGSKRGMNRPWNRPLGSVCGIIAGAALAGGCGDGTPAFRGPTAALYTSEGTIVLGLHRDRTPTSVDNFLSYVDAGHYDGLIFHRIVPGFMIQAGGFDRDMTPREPDQRGCQISLRIARRSCELFELLHSGGMVGDYRQPDVLRFAPVPLYNTFHEVWRLGREIVDSCLQYWGGQGYMWESSVARAFRDMRLSSIGGGADEVMLSIICKLDGTLPR